MTPIPYNPTRDALYRPASARDFFTYQYPSTAALCAELSRFVYYGKGGRIDQDKLRGYLRDVFELRAVADVKNSQAFVVENDAFLVMVFRGTEADVRDVLTDLDFFPKRWRLPSGPAGRVHRGFARALRHVLAVLKAALPPPEGKPLVVTGHSLGGAMATLGASLLQPAGLYTFGEPRVGNNEFAAAMNRQVDAGMTYQRFVDCCDIVTRVPPGFAGFRHAGDLHYIDRHGQIHVNPDKAVISKDRSRARHCYWRTHSFGRGNVLVRDLADHAPINYLSAISGAREGVGV